MDLASTTDIVQTSKTVQTLNDANDDDVTSFLSSKGIDNPPSTKTPPMFDLFKMFIPQNKDGEKQDEADETGSKTNIDVTAIGKIFDGLIKQAVQPQPDSKEASTDLNKLLGPLSGIVNQLLSNNIEREEEKEKVNGDEPEGDKLSEKTSSQEKNEDLPPTLFGLPLSSPVITLIKSQLKDEIKKDLLPELRAQITEEIKGMRPKKLLPSKSFQDQLNEKYGPGSRLIINSGYDSNIDIQLVTWADFDNFSSGMRE